MVGSRAVQGWSNGDCPSSGAKNLLLSVTMPHHLEKIFSVAKTSIVHGFVKRFTSYCVSLKSLVVYTSIVLSISIVLALYLPTIYKRPRGSRHSDSSRSSSDNYSLHSSGAFSNAVSGRRTTLEVFASSASFSPLRKLSESPPSPSPKRFQLTPPFVQLMLSPYPVLKRQTRSRDTSLLNLQVEKPTGPQKPWARELNLHDPPLASEVPLDSRSKQPYEAFLVLDVEGTCQLGSDYNYPNEIIVRDNFTNRYLPLSLFFDT